jgi:hypothetical protein
MREEEKYDFEKDTHPADPTINFGICFWLVFMYNAVWKGDMPLLSLTLDESSVKGFMNRLLKDDIFDTFEIRGIEIAAVTRISISGYKDQEPDDSLTWAECKPLITAIIKSGSRPRYMKVIFCNGIEATAALHENAQALFINMTYDNGQVIFTTACAQKEFALDKSLDIKWDSHVMAFFKKYGIDVKESI